MSDNSTQRETTVRQDAHMDAQSKEFNSRMENTRPMGRGAATSFTNQYNVGQYMYPTDLMSPEQSYAGNYVIFYINVHEDSSLLRDSKVAVVQGNIPNRTNGFLSGQQINEKNAKFVSLALGMTAGAAVGNVISSVTGINVGGPIVGLAAATATVNEVGKMKAEYKRIDTAIALHMPTELNTAYNVSWDTESLDGTSAMMGIGDNVLNAMKFGAKGTGNSIEELKTALSTGSSFLASATLGAGPGQFVAKSSGTAGNPKKEQLFKSVNHRSFSFSYQFFARSPEEAQNIQNIIKLFKMHMHPEYKRNTGNFLYVYPSEFDIFYYHNGVENMHLHRHTSCVLENMTVQYTPLGQFTSFTDGQPVQINITLQFKELALLSKELIEDGF